VVEPGGPIRHNIDDHHHFFSESVGSLADIPGVDVVVSGLPFRRPVRDPTIESSSGSAAERS